jgi:hypothetical protein
MKTRNCLCLVILLALSPLPSAFSQSPQGFNYQALARDASKNPITVPLDVRFTVRADSVSGTIFWVEEHYGVQPNEFGVFNVVVGRGTRISGLAKFSDIDWTVTPKYLMTEINHGGWKFLGSSRLWTVPYAMVADSLGGSLKKLIVEGNTSNMDEPLFEVKNTAGMTVFAVYNEGVRVFVDNNGEVKGTKGGFAVGGFGDAKAPSQNYLFVSGDSIRAYIGPVPTGGKTSKGGFAVGGFDSAKEGTGEYLRVTRDSTRIYVNETAKTTKGGFAVGGFSGAKNTTTDLMRLTKDNYFIGHESGSMITSGIYNSFFGYQSGKSTTEGSDNLFVGYQSGFSNQLGLNNIFIGKNSGFNNIGEIQTVPFYLAYGSYNVFIGNNAGFSNISGWTNLFLGNSAGYSNDTGSDNTFVGNLSGEYNTSGSCNAFFGAFSGRKNSTGDFNTGVGFYSGNKNESSSNTFVGAYSGENNISGTSNTFIGISSGRNSTGFGNVFIGSNAGSAETGNNKLYIANSNTASPLIYGDFGGSSVRINGSLCYTGSAGTCSDSRYKKEVSQIKDALSILKSVRGVYYYWNKEAFPEMNFNENRQIGIIAQEVENYLPELVTTDHLGYKMVDYSKLSPVLLEAINEQQMQIESVNEENRQLKSELKSLKERLAQIEAVLLSDGTK